MMLLKRKCLGIAAVQLVCTLCLALIAPPTALAEEVVTITWLTWADAVRAQAWQVPMIEAFEAAHPGIKVELYPAPQDYWDRLHAMHAAGIAPDVFFVGEVDAAYFATNGMTRDLMPFIERSEGGFDLEQLFPWTYPPFEWQGGQYGLPLDWTSEALYYRPDDFMMAGLPLPDENLTWSEFLAQSRRIRLTDPDTGIITRYPIALGLGYNRWAAFVQAFGGQAFVKAGAKMVLPHFRCNLDTGRRIFLESREPLYDTQDWGFVACGGSSGDLAWSLSKRDRIPPRSFWSWKARP